MTLDFLKSIDCNWDAICCKCDKRKATIFYVFGLGHRDKYRPFCDGCCEELALGMMRDVAEVQYGKEKADKWYRELHTLKAIQSLHIKNCLKESLRESINEVIDNSMKEKPIKLANYGPVFERIVSTAMLHDALAYSFGITVAELKTKVDITAIKLEGGAFQIVTINKDEKP